MLTEQQKAARKDGKAEKFSIDMVAALKGSEFKDKAELLAGELKKVNINYPDQITNAPVKLKVTYGVNIQTVVELVQAHYADAPEEPTPKATKKATAK